MMEDGVANPSPPRPQYETIRVTVTNSTGKELKALAMSLGLGGSGTKAALVKKIRQSGHPDVTPHDDPNSFTIRRLAVYKVGDPDLYFININLTSISGV